MKVYNTNIYKLEIDITHMCTLRCHNCDRGISIAPGDIKHNMELSQLKKFIIQSIANKYQWQQIRIMGGEPTLHPNFKEIVKLFNDYKEEHNKDLKLIISTNGYAKETILKVEWVKENYPNIEIENTSKKNNFQRDFNMIHIAPCDIHDNEYKYKYNGCWTTEACAIGLNYSGFYCCAVGGAIARIFNYDIGIKNIEDINVENFEKMFGLLCSKCGRYHEIKVDNSNIETILSPTWKSAINSYNGKNNLSRY